VKSFEVGVFTHERPGRKPLVTAYTTWYNPEWKGCCVHKIDAENGTEAKKLAIRDHRNLCMPKEG